MNILFIYYILYGQKWAGKLIECVEKKIKSLSKINHIMEIVQKKNITSNWNTIIDTGVQDALVVLLQGNKQ